MGRLTSTVNSKIKYPGKSRPWVSSEFSHCLVFINVKLNWIENTFCGPLSSRVSLSSVETNNVTFSICVSSICFTTEITPQHDKTLTIHSVSEEGVLTDLLVMLLGFKTDDLQDAWAGYVRHNIRHALPHAQQGTAQHVVLTEAHALQTLLAFLNLLTLPIPEEEGTSLIFFFWTLQKAISVLRTAQQANFLLTDCFVQEFYNTSVVTEAHESPAGSSWLNLRWSANP